MLIIINDVDSIHTGRDAFPLLVDEIERVGLTVNCELRRRFKNQGYFFQIFNEKHVLKGIKHNFSRLTIISL